MGFQDPRDREPKVGRLQDVEVRSQVPDRIDDESFLGPRAAEQVRGLGEWLIPELLEVQAPSRPPLRNQKTRLPLSSAEWSNGLPVSSDQAGKSAMAPRSVASTFNTWPACSVFISFAVLTTGIGQSRPRASNSRSSLNSVISSSPR